MHVEKLFHKWLSEVMPQMHKTRLKSVYAVGGGALRGGWLNVTSLGRSIHSDAKAKHRIKRADRLFSNQHLQSERVEFYKRLGHQLLCNIARPVILVDWADIDARRKFFLLRAAIATKGRSPVVYEEVHERSQREKREVHDNFLKRLREVVPAECVPIIVTDAGFRAVWFQQVRAFGWDYVGRIRNLERVQLAPESEWIGARSLFSHATGKPHVFEGAILTLRYQMECSLVIFKNIAKGRKRLTKMGSRSRSSMSVDCAASAKEPWLLATSLKNDEASPHRIVQIYASRMQIEESFRDLKCPRYGLGLYHNGTYKIARMEILLLIGAIATTFAWLLGKTAKYTQQHRQFQANTTTSVPVLSNVFIGRHIFRDACLTISWSALLGTISCK